MSRGIAERGAGSAASAPASHPIAPFVALRVVIPAAALAAAVWHMTGGEASLPLWIWKLAVRFDASGETAVRLLASAEATIAIVMAASGRLARPGAVVAIALLAFSAVAELSALISVGAAPGAFAAPLLALAVAGVMAAVLSRWSTRPEKAPLRPIGVGHLLAASGALFFNLGLMARLPVAERPRPVPPALRNPGGILFGDLDRLVGRSLPEAGLARHQPQLTAMTIEGRHVLVFYNPRCGECRDLFETFFAGDSHPELIAVEVPPPAGALVLEGDPPFEPQCRDCRRTRLAEGPAYFRKTPVVMVVENGRITCVEDREPLRCIDF